MDKGTNTTRIAVLTPQNLEIDIERGLKAWRERLQDMEKAKKFFGDNFTEAEIIERINDHIEFLTILKKNGEG